MGGVKQKQLRLIDERLISAMSHETRVHALAVLHERPASAKEVAGELGQSISAVWYHMNKLLELGCIELVGTKRRRGATERFYKATVAEFFDDETWSRIPENKRISITVNILKLIANDIDEAIQAGTVDTVDNHLTRSPINLDRQGWEDANALLDETLEGVMKIREEAALRMAGSTERPIRSSLAMMIFELPSRKPA